jgi:hypothetical protein
MPHGMNDKLVVGGFVENNIRIGRGRHAADCGIIRARTHERMLHKRIDHQVNAAFDARRAFFASWGDMGRRLSFM